MAFDIFEQFFAHAAAMHDRAFADMRGGRHSNSSSNNSRSTRGRDPFGDPFDDPFFGNPFDDPFFGGRGGGRGGLGMGGMFGSMQAHFDEMQREMEPSFHDNGGRSLLHGGGSNSNALASRNGENYSKDVTVHTGRDGTKKQGAVVGRSSSTSTSIINGKRKMIKETQIMYADGSREVVREEIR